MHRFYTIHDRLQVTSKVALPNEEAQHARDSLRLQAGDEIILFNGDQEAKAVLTKVTKDEVGAEVTELLTTTTLEDPSTNINLYMGIIKINLFELVLKSATELGVDTIVPVNSEFSGITLPPDTGKKTRWEKIVLAACKQSERRTIPKVSSPQDLDKLTPIGTKLCFTLPRQTELPVTPVLEVQQMLTDNQDISILIGPEGGFSPREHDLLLDQGWTLVSLGDDLILKSETAATAALSVVNILKQR